MKKSKLIPLGKRVLIEKPEVPEPKTQSGILLTSSATPDPENIAKVLAVGDEVMNIFVGDEIVFPQYGFVEITEDGTDYYILDAADILAKRAK